MAGRIRALREARGLTQAQLAGGTYSKGFISLLETGRVALSMDAAMTLAPRLGVSVSELIASPASTGALDLELALARAEAAFAAGHSGEALEIAGPASSARGVPRARWLRLRGRVIAQTENARDAVDHLEEAVRIFRDARERELTARTLYDLAVAYGRIEAHGEAVHRALLCESAMYAGDVVDRTLELRLLSLLAGLLVTIGDVAAADLRIERAKSVAQDVNDPRAIGNLYASLSITRERQGDLEAALLFAKKSLAAYEEMGARAHIGNMWNTVGWVYIERKQFEEARRALDQAGAIASESQDPRLAAYVLQNQAELALAQDRVDDALRFARESIGLAGASGRGVALSRLILAKAIARSPAKDDEVDDAFERAAGALRPFGKALELRAHRAHFDALMRRGRPDAAADAAARAFGVLGA